MASHHEKLTVYLEELGGGWPREGDALALRYDREIEVMPLACER
jgi:hypothetical protein